MSMVPASLAFKAFDHPPKKYGLNLKSPLMPPVRSEEKKSTCVLVLQNCSWQLRRSVDREEKRSDHIRASKCCAGGR